MLKRFWNWAFKDSETLLLARLQMLVGTLMVVDLAPILPAKYLPVYVVVMGLVTELARRSRADDL